MRFSSNASVLLMAVLLSPFVHAQEKMSEPKPVPRESLRYDGKPFEYWQTYWQTELKAERRVECLRAMGAFGSNGYGPEAAAVIVGLIRSYPETPLVFYDYSVGDRDKLTPDENVFHEASEAMKKIGPAGVSAILANTSNPNIRSLARHLLTKGFPIAIPQNAVPRVVSNVISGEKEERDLGLYLLHFQVLPDDKLSKTLVKELSKSDAERKFFKAIFRNTRDHDSHYFSSISLDEFLINIAGQSPNSMPILIAELHGLKNARPKDVEDWRSKLSESERERFGPSHSWETRSRYLSVVIAKVLGKMGPAARDALPELREALTDPYVELQTAAKTAIEQITKKQP